MCEGAPGRPRAAAPHAPAPVVPLNVVLQTYAMRLVPDGFLGRVAAVNRFGAYGLEWCGPLLAGLLALLFGVRAGVGGHDLALVGEVVEGAVRADVLRARCGCTLSF